MRMLSTKHFMSRVSFLVAGFTLAIVIYVHWGWLCAVMRRMCDWTAPATAVQKVNTNNITHQQIQSLCQPPECYRVKPAFVAPKGMKIKEIPQIVHFSFDGPVTAEVLKAYKRLFPRRKVNPNGCPIAATFYVSNQHTDFRLVKQLYQRGHEIGVDSFSRKPKTWWDSATYGNISNEILAMRSKLNKKASVPVLQIKGAKAPYLRLGPPDNRYDILEGHNFLYDASIKTNTAKDSAMWEVYKWPYTMDTVPEHPYVCFNKNCPKKPHPRLWQVPVHPWFNKKNVPCGYDLTRCSHQTKSTTSFKAFLLHNLELHRTEKTPFGVHIHSKWLTPSNKSRSRDKVKAAVAALDQFLRTVMEMESDVWVVTTAQLIEWMKEPTPLTSLKTFPAWQCTDAEKLKAKERRPRRHRK